MYYIEYAAENTKNIFQVFYIVFNITKAKQVWRERSDTGTKSAKKL